MITREGGQLAIGIFIGFLVALVFALLFSLQDSGIFLNESAVGAIIGGLIAGAVALAGQTIVVLDATKRRDDEAFEKKKAAAQTLMLKLQAAYDLILKHHNYYRTHDNSSAVNVHTQDTRTGEVVLCAVLVKPLQGRNRDISIEINEKVFALNEKAVDFFNDLSDLEGILGNLELLESTYHEYFEAFEQRQLAGGSVGVVGRHVQSQSEPDELGLLRATDCLEQLRAALAKALPLVRRLNQNILPIIRDRYGMRVDIQFDETISGASDRRTA